MARKSAEMTKRLKIAGLLAEKFPPVRKNALFNRQDVLGEMKLGGKERESWDSWLGALGHESVKIAVTAERVSPLAPILGVEVDHLLSTLDLQPAAAPKDTKKGLVEIVKAFMKREGLDSLKLVEQLTTADEALALSSEIDDFLLAGGPMPADLMGRIATKFDVDPVTLEKREPKKGTGTGTGKDDEGSEFERTLDDSEGGIALQDVRLIREDDKNFIVVGGKQVLSLQVSDQVALEMLIERRGGLAAVLDELLKDE